jgi:hypothetical protein
MNIGHSPLTGTQLLGMEGLVLQRVLSTTDARQRYDFPCLPIKGHGVQTTPYVAERPE